ncbi:MAG: tetratricopeptide repeat protein [Vicinamibacterales bacterium]
MPAPLRLIDLPRLVHRELVLLVVLSVLAVGAYFGTQAAAAAAREQVRSDAARWYERGRARLEGGLAVEAVEPLRRAVARDPEQWEYGRTLAEALAAAGQPALARQTLQQWRLRRPEDVEVSTQLARLEARQGEADAAVAYYENALHGQWAPGALAGRQALRRELIAYLLSQGRSAPALSHVLALAANQPDQPAAHAETARLFLTAGDPRRALEYYDRALRLAPDDLEAKVGAGEAAFELGDYPRTVRLLRGVEDERSQTRARIAADVLAFDPLQPRLSFAERERRLRRALDYALARLAACAPAAAAPEPTPPAPMVVALTDYRDGLTPRALREAPDALEEGLGLVYRALQSGAARCGPLDDRGEALLRAARDHGATG